MSSPTDGLFSPTSRYAGTETATLRLPDGREVVYLRRRFVPAPEALGLLALHVVATGETRLDQIAARPEYYADPEQYWRLCDANRALRPDELLEGKSTGEKILLRIPMPEGMPGTEDSEAGDLGAIDA